MNFRNACRHPYTHLRTNTLSKNGKYYMFTFQRGCKNTYTHARMHTVTYFWSHKSSNTKTLCLLKICTFTDAVARIYIYRCIKWQLNVYWQVTPPLPFKYTHIHTSIQDSKTDCSNTTLSGFLFSVISSFLFALWLNILLACMISFNFDFLFFQDGILGGSNFQPIPQFSTPMTDNTRMNGCSAKEGNW